MSLLAPGPSGSTGGLSPMLNTVPSPTGSTGGKAHFPIQFLQEKGKLYITL